jgi:hypothetical protein
MHRLPRHPITARNSADHRPFQNLKHRPITHFGHPQLPQHASPSAVHQRPRKNPSQPLGVKLLPELLSRTYRDRVPELSSTNRNPTEIERCYDWAVAARFPASQAQLPLPPRSKITHEGTTCAVTPDGRTYCERGAMRFVIEPTKTWLSAPWTDLSWMEHMTEGIGN